MDFFERRAETIDAAISRTRDNYRSSAAILVGAAGITASVQISETGKLATLSFGLATVAAACGILVLWPRKRPLLRLDVIRECLRVGANTSNQAAFESVQRSLDTLSETIEQARLSLKQPAWLLRVGFLAMGFAVAVPAGIRVFEFIQNGK